MNVRKYCRKSDAVPQGKGVGSGQDRERSKEVEELRARRALVLFGAGQAVHRRSREKWGTTRCAVTLTQMALEAPR